MRIPVFVLGLMVLLAFDTLGQVGFKLTAESVGAGRLDPDWLLGLLRTPTIVLILGAYLGAFVTYMSMMRKADIGPLFAAAHLELVTVTLISVAWFGERFGVAQGAGCALILCGVFVLGATEDGEGRPGT